ncbi:MAG: hypothetical protein U0V49_13435 [Saprospiraceae bacterium]
MVELQMVVGNKKIWLMLFASSGRLGDINLTVMVWVQSDGSGR